jgi:dimethylhistidine N-methyltransferase
MSRPRVPESQFVSTVDPTDAAQFAADVQYYLTQDPRQLPSRYLYDALGSALFEAICRLPWYRITRAEERLLAVHGADVFRRVQPFTIVELGSGSGEKLRILLAGRGSDADSIDVHLVDVSSGALEASARALQAFEHVRVTAHHASYEDGLRDVCLEPAPENRVLVMFLGSNIGNYDPPGANAFLRGVRGKLRAGDALLLGADLIKPEPELRLAYDDPLGVTAAFNRNLLVRINRELGANFDVGQFAHEAVWNAVESRIEMHLVARAAQELHVTAANVAFTMAEGDRIWTESSYKYRPNEISGLVESAGFRVMMQWLDRADQFALTLADAV